MNYYPPALDYAMYVLGAAGLILWVSLRGQATGRRKGALKLAACLLVGVALTCGGMGGVLFNRRAPIYETTGLLENIVRTTGRNSHVEFSLRTPSGIIGPLSTADLTEFQGGETAEVSYQAASLRVLHIRVLDGRAKGFEHQTSNGTLGAFLTIFAGLGLFAYGLLNYASDGAGGPDDEREGTVPAPDGDVDSKSMLGL